MTYLHSNMVRFIIILLSLRYKRLSFIYIPIWLDLLLELNHLAMQPIYDLNSNMVRFIINKNMLEIGACRKFTFQYG